MTQTPAGWYADPDPTSAGTGRIRYWDGAGWTEHTHDPAPSATPTYPTYQQQDPAYGQVPYEQVPYGQAPTSAATTPDGQELAGWWRRALALLLDLLIALPLYALAAVPVVVAQWDDLTAWFDDLTYALDNDLPEPPDPALVDPGQTPFWILVGSVTLASMVYQVVFLLWKQATPGKLVVGLRVRLRDRPELPAGAVVVRVLGVFLLSICWVGQLLDYLWPLWDGKKQALHDKMARTNVVRLP